MVFAFHTGFIHKCIYAFTQLPVRTSLLMFQIFKNTKIVKQYALLLYNGNNRCIMYNTLL